MPNQSMSGESRPGGPAAVPRRVVELEATTGEGRGGEAVGVAEAVQQTFLLNEEHCALITSFNLDLNRA